MARIRESQQLWPLRDHWADNPRCVPSRDQYRSGSAPTAISGDRAHNAQRWCQDDDRKDRAVATTSSTVRRNSLRYPGYDYSQPGAIFVTIRTHDRQRLFGSVVNGEVALSPPGVAAERYWLRIPERFPGAMVDSFVIMPLSLYTSDAADDLTRVDLG